MRQISLFGSPRLRTSVNPRWAKAAAFESRSRTASRSCGVARLKSPVKRRQRPRMHSFSMLRQTARARSGFMA
eukprot:9353774-Lingulodinium_polyedra.AAC.1